MTSVKICGIRDSAALKAAADAGARFAGFVFHPKSPRNVEIGQAARLVRETQLITVGLFVDPDDETLSRVLAEVPLKIIQLHGDETPARAAAVRSLSGLSVMKAIRVATKEDLAAAKDYRNAIDWLLFDAKVEGLQGGTGRTFDWTIMEGFETTKPWMLAGGLTPENVGEAVRKLRPGVVDVSSGVESAPGVKDPCKIAAFIESVRSCTTP